MGVNPPPPPHPHHTHTHKNSGSTYMYYSLPFPGKPRSCLRRMQRPYCISQVWKSRWSRLDSFLKYEFHMKTTFCMCENKVADQLCGNREADQRLCFCYTDNTFPLLSKSNFQPLAIFCACTAWFVLDLFKNHIVDFSSDGSNMSFT